MDWTLNVWTALFGLLCCTALLAHDTKGVRVSRLWAIDRVCADPLLPRAASLYPVSNQVLPPFIIHLTADRAFESSLSFLCDETNLPPSLMKELVAFGAVYYRQGSGDKAKLNRLRLLPSSVPKGSYARVHVNPRRYSHYYSVPSWKERVLFSNDELVVVDKPALCIPSVETVDNAVENIINGVSTELNCRSLLPCGRLDASTSGVIVFAKNAAAAKKVNAAFVSNEVKKTYRALVLLPTSSSESLLKPGSLRHLYRKKSKSHPNAKPTLLRNINNSQGGVSEDGEWQSVELIIRDVGPEHLFGPSRLRVREVLIELVTGKTHQIRLQLASLGHPIVGDTRLIPAAGLLDDPPSSFGDGSALFGPEPRSSIGLHCAGLELLGHKFEAESPWWRDDKSTEKEKSG